jgi:hypothetical protein
MEQASLIKRLIQEALSTPPKKESCNCGCHSCENVGNPGPVLNESLNTKVVMTENMKYHVENKLPITENMFRYGSEAFLDMWAEARYLFSRNAIHVNDFDKEILLETNLGEYGMYEGQKVPLDLPMLEEVDKPILPYSDLLDQIKADSELAKMDSGKLMDLYFELEQSIFDGNLDNVSRLLRNYGVYNKYISILQKRLNEDDKKKTPALNKPKRGGSKKFYVYVRDPKSKRIKKVSFGMAGGGLRAKLNNPKARQAFSKRHNCPQKTDKTKASYWSCRLPRYAKALGFNTTFSGYW